MDFCIEKLLKIWTTVVHGERTPHSPLPRPPHLILFWPSFARMCSVSKKAASEVSFVVANIFRNCSQSCLFIFGRVLDRFVSIAAEEF